MISQIQEYFFLEKAKKLIYTKADSGLFYFYQGENEYLQGEDTKGQSFFPQKPSIP